ncbi:amidase [Sulfitobacter aestuariivivens]|uniref:amidase n=1 Tax=Sulfitobacter aestuariivivens TaxID=2766981 RepID=UPI00361D074A
MTEILKWSAVETVAHLKARDVSAREVTEAHLARIDAVNPSLNAIVDDVPDAIDRAKAIDAGKIDPGILHGAPVTTKINTDQKGLVNTNGLPAMKHNVAPDDAAVVRNLHAAGAVVVGRTNTPEMSLRWCTSNPLHGITLNPWDDTVTPGGSSGGASAALAAGIGVIAHGNDLGGSVRYPAYCCGLVGLRPSRGRIANYNPSVPGGRAPMTAAMAVQGPLGRSVADVRLGLEAMRGFAAEDPAWTAASGNGRLKTGRIGVATDFYEDAQHPTVRDAMERAAQAAKSSGCDIMPVKLPDTDRISELWGQLLFTETEVLSKADIETYGSADLQRWLETFTTQFGLLDLAGYMNAIAERSVLQRRWARMFETIDAVIMPTSLSPPLRTTSNSNTPDVHMNSSTRKSRSIS